MIERPTVAAALLAAALAAQGPPLPAAPQTQGQPPRHLVLVRTSGPAQMAALLALDLDLAGCRRPLLAERRVEVIVDESELATLQNAGFSVRVLQRDLEAFWAARAAAAQPAGYPDLPNPPLGQGAMGGHWTLAQMESILDDLHNANPAICSSKTAIGQSVEGRSIWMVKISDNVTVDENEPEVLYDALHHAREPLSMETTVVFMDWLVNNYGTDPEATLIVDERELFFVPCVNPDGYVYNETTNPNGGGLWRKNRRDLGGGNFGVDLNRNYATAWNAPNGGSSTSPSSSTYRGPSAFSEPETQAIEAFSQSRQFVTVWSTHTYTEILLRPWGWQNGDPANVADYQVLGDFYTVENGMPHGAASTSLYIASGTALDHHHTARGSYGWTAELGLSSEGAFWPTGQAIIDIAMRHQPMFRRVALSAGPAFAVADVTVTEGPGSNGNGTVEPGELGDVVVTVQNAGLAAAPAGLVLQSLTAGVTVVSGAGTTGGVAPLSTAQNGAPLTFVVAPTVSAPTAQLRITVTGDGRATTHDVDVDLIARRTVLTDDFEQDRGFARAVGGTASTGLWERAAPQATSSGGNPIQPGAQTTPGGSLCWVTDGRAGNNAGTWDVDGGFTELVTPRLDLAHMQSAELSMQYWYAESQANDAMTVEVSRDGGANWSPLFSRSNETGAWTLLELDLGQPLTSQMVVRVRAEDLSPSLVECLVDDFELRGQLPDGSITLLASGAPGTTVQVAMHAEPAALCFALAAFATAPAQTFPGIGGALLLDQTSTSVLPFASADAGGRAVVEFVLPGGAGFPGLVLHWQAAYFGAGGAAFGANVTALTL